MQLFQFFIVAAFTATFTGAARDARVKKKQEQHILSFVNQTHAWGPSEVQCSRDSKKPCPKCKIVRKIATCSDYGVSAGDKVDVKTFPVRVATHNDDLPEEMQGVFWLTDQGPNSALISFAQGEDGGGYGKFDDSGTFYIRVGLGDRVWSFHDTPGMSTAEKADLYYTFNFDSRQEPKFASIYGRSASTNIGFGKVSYWLGLLKFDLHLLECPQDQEKSKDKEDPCNKFQGSVIWQRKSSFLGMDLKKGTYQAVQVIKPDGTKLPAFYQWIEYCKQPEQGKTPDKFHYHEIDNNKACS